MIEEWKFPTELKLWKYELERLALRIGLKLLPTKYTIVEFDEMSELVATHGFPVVIPHWRNGQEAVHGEKHYKYGMGLIYEMVINTYPVHAYLHHCNTVMTQKSVMAHVNGHVDIFARNVYFKPTNRRMIDTMADFKMKFDQYVADYGEERVKKFYDTLLSFEWCIDPNSLYIRRGPRRKPDAEMEQDKKDRKIPKRITVPEDLPGYLDEWLNPSEWFDEQKKKLEEEDKERSLVEKGVKLPPRPTQDLLQFLYYYAPLEEFERGLIDMARAQSYYFAPMARTKLMHEGWASLIEEMIMSEPRVLLDSEVRPFAVEMSSVQRPSKRGINPYRLGYDLLKDIWFRWDTGRHGDIWERCEERNIKERWDEFVIFKNLLESSAGDLSSFAKSWREFSAFLKALKDGKLAVPAEFFIRNLFTKQYLVPTWLKYLNAEKEYRCSKKMLKEIRPLEKAVLDNFEECRAPESNGKIPKNLLLIKARKDTYAARNKKDLYIWSQDEVEAELYSLKALLDFKKNFNADKTDCDELPIPEEWFSYARRFPGFIELGKGKEKIFDVTETYDDLMLIEEFFTQEFCLEHKYFVYKAKAVWDWENYPETSQHYFFDSRAFERVKRFLLFRYTNMYTPIIKVIDGNYNNNGELYLKHEHNGVDLDYWTDGGMHIKDVLERLYRLWGSRPVHLETIKTKVPEERPWWYYWHQTEEKSADEPEELDGVRVLCTWGHTSGHTYGEKNVGYSETTLENVKFISPF